jgi:hypothetical protein
LVNVGETTKPKQLIYNLRIASKDVNCGRLFAPRKNPVNLDLAQLIEEKRKTPVKDEGRQRRDGMQRRMRERKPNTLEKATSLIRLSKNGEDVRRGWFAG